MLKLEPILTIYVFTLYDNIIIIELTNKRNHDQNQLLENNSRQKHQNVNIYHDVCILPTYIGMKYEKLSQSNLNLTM